MLFCSRMDLYVAGSVAEPLFFQSGTAMEVLEVSGSCVVSCILVSSGCRCCAVCCGAMLSKVLLMLSGPAAFPVFACASWAVVVVA